MTVSRRSAMVCVSALAATAADSALASTMRGVQAALTAGGNLAPGMDQRVDHLLVHRDAVAGAPHFAPISIASDDTAWMAHNDLDENAYLQVSGKYAMRGYRLRRVSAFQTKNGMRYAAVWQLASGPAWETHHGMTPAQFRARSGSFAARGYAVTHVDACATNAGVRFAAIWEKRSAPEQQTFAALTAAQFKQKSAELAAQGYRPRQIAGYTPDGRALFAATFEKNGAAGWRAHHAMTASALRERSNALHEQGYRLSDASGYVVRGRAVFSGIWEKA